MINFHTLCWEIYNTCHPFVFIEQFTFKPSGSQHKASACHAKDTGLISTLGRCPGEGNGNPLQYFCLENALDGGAW